MNVLLMILVVAVLYVIAKVALNEPIIPGKDNTIIQLSKKKKGKHKKHKAKSQDAELFRELFSKVEDIRDHMIVLKNNKYNAIVEVSPVNYFLKSQEEQEAIDRTVEVWLSQLNYPAIPYFQNRFVDLSEPVEQYETILKNEEFNDLAYEYGRSVVNDLKNWQESTPLYETKIYVQFPYQIDPQQIDADSDEEFQEKADAKAFQEIFRRINTAQNRLSKVDIELDLLTSNGLIELLYYTMNRRKAKKNKFKDLRENENLALYVTAEQSEQYLAKIKEELRQSETVEQNEEQAEQTDEAAS